MAAAPGDVLFYPGDTPAMIYALVEGIVGAQSAPGLLDAVAVLGGLPQQIKAEVRAPSVLLAWPADDFWAVPGLQTAARAYLARALGASEMRRATLEAPLASYDVRAAQGLPGPFIFQQTTMIFAFCEAERAPVEALLPPDLALLQRPGKVTAPILIALADFPASYPEEAPDARFSYTETTVFVPVRYKTAFGLFVPLIFPSAYEPILLGREFYGFPKQLARTDIRRTGAELLSQGGALRVGWSRSVARNEPDIVGGLVGWLGLSRGLGALAFGAGEILRGMARLPATRRVDVYNRKRIPAAESTRAAPRWAVDELTRATFGVLRWYHIEEATDPHLAADGPLFDDFALAVGRVYRAQLDMRLSTGRTLERYV